MYIQHQTSQPLTTMFDVKKYFSGRFDSTNFKQTYYSKIEAVCKTQGLYSHLTGQEPRPSMPLGTVTGPAGVTPVTRATVPPEEHTAWVKESLAWDKEDLQLMGIIQITTTKEVFDPIKDMNAEKAWEQLNLTYSEPTLSAIYGDFIKLVSFRLTTSHPQAGIAKFKSYIERLSEVGVVLPELIKSLLLIATIPPEWDAVSSKFLHDYVRDPEDEDCITVLKVHDAIMVEYECQNPQLANRLSVVKRAGNREPLFSQQQRLQQQHQQRGYQQQTNTRPPQQRQQRPSSNQNKGKKKKQQQCGTCSGINQHQGPGNASGNSGNNRSRGHSHLASYASVVASPPPVCPYSSITDRRECIALNAVNNSLRAEITSTPPSRARGSPPPAHFTGHWDKSFDSTVAPAVTNHPTVFPFP
ncbi:hypothetical protein AAF712_001552 [Marasmius tenuissimus]|uniref:Gag protein n=1 Tax=Marasmius tenuissimus TaxID=585030 RepID=A0ABR3AC70_9AGAR